MALFECKKKSADAKTEYMYYSSKASGTFTDTCEIGDIYVFEFAYNKTPTDVIGLEYLADWQCGSQVYYKAYLYRATSTSISLTFPSTINCVRISKRGKPISYDLIDLTANVEKSISCETYDILCLPFHESSYSYTLGSNILKMADLNQGDKRISVFRAIDTTVGIKHNRAVKILRFY